MADRFLSALAWTLFALWLVSSPWFGPIAVGGLLIYAGMLVDEYHHGR